MDKKKKVAIIGTNGIPARYGGFETLAHYLTNELSKDFDFTVYCSKIYKKSERTKSFNNSKLVYIPLKANGAQSIIYDMLSISLSWFKYDTLLVLGTGGCIVLPFFRFFKKTNTVVNFGGLEWKRNKWGKIGSWYLKLSERMAIKNATSVVADNQYFCNYIKDVYKKPSTLIEYGGDHTIKIQIDEQLLNKYPFLANDYDVSVSRAQADNNLHLLLDAYSKVPERNLVLVSNYNKFEYGRNLKNKYSHFPNLFLQDAVYIQKELDAIRSNANLYIHSHSFCGTAPSLVEAMCLGLPIIAFDVPTNHFTTEDSAIYFKDEADLFKIISNLEKSQIGKLSHNMLSIASNRYKWQIISNKYSELF